MAAKTRHLRNEKQKNLVKLFDAACYRHNRGQVWADFVMMAAIAISNAVDKSNAEERESLYLKLASQYNKKELSCFTQMFAEIVNGMEDNQDQDFLGELFMTLELSNSFAGQFFTPYSLCQAMARMTAQKDNILGQIERDGWISVSDPACGAGATLVAFAGWCRECGINYHDSVLFVAQDIDITVACMCYIQLSLLGCPGYVVVDNTLTKPSVACDDRGLIPKHGPNVWYTPFYFKDVWHWRRTMWQADQLFKLIPTSRQTEVREEKPEVDEIQVPETRYAETNTGQLTIF